MFEEVSKNSAHRRRRQPWLAPLGIFAHLAWRILDVDPLSRRIIWIGGRCIPYPRTLVRAAQADARLLHRSLFVQAPNRAARLWAADLALRSSAIGTVFVDGSGFDAAATRRLHLVARAHGKLVLAARPIAERSMHSAAVTRWIVRPRPPDNDDSRCVLRPRWHLSLIRCRVAAACGDDAHWLLEWNHAQGNLDLYRRLARSADAAETTPARSLRQPQSA